MDILMACSEHLITFTAMSARVRSLWLSLLFQSISNCDEIQSFGIPVDLFALTSASTPCTMKFCST